MSSGTTWPYRHKPFEDAELRDILEAADRWADHGDKSAKESRVMAYTLAYTGVRIGEFTHMEADWVKFQRDELRIPAYRPCPCSECVNRADALREDREKIPPGGYDDVQAIGENGEVLNRYKKYAERDGVGRRSLDDLLDNYDGVWLPKSGHGSRMVPVRDQDALQALRDWFRLYDDIPYVRQTWNGRLESLANQGDIRFKVHPHRFRHFYGTHLAANGFGPYEIKNVMGHGDIQTSMTYVEFSGERLHDSFNENWNSV